MKNQWYLKPIIDGYHGPDKTKYKAESKKLKYCNSCSKVWEFQAITRICHRYDDFPTYGLERKFCKYCEKDKYEK
tara:strand:- start:1906 stop:2130 length:225 start_codon:yes stop_codon:yes gene_type:complete